MDKKELQELLSQSYRQENWKRIVSFVFPNVSLLSTPKEFPIRNDKIKTFRQLGNVRLNDGKNLALFELLLSDSVNIQRNRVELNNEISKYIDQEQIHGVLSVFEKGTDDYRFTFSARSTKFDEQESDIIQKKTDTKRYTYVLGKNESCKTPAERFFKLREKRDAVKIGDIENAFSVEQLSIEFFKKYEKQFKKFWKYVHTNELYNGIIFGSDREKGIRDFIKKLLSRIVFLHFLQKKGWMGCTSGINEWEDGNKQFMQMLFENYSNQSEFHSKCLSELFYNTLNKKRIGELFECDGLVGDLNKSKVPYLNGGLFDSDEDITRKVDFPASYFEELFDFFGQYNFTIDENDPNDHEVGIDPEMLGHIFENLLEDNKDKGTFYTPKVIVQYMCQESIIEYIDTKINECESPEIKSAIEDLIRNKLGEKCSDLDLVHPISKALFDVKICDPAIGSGAFPMGILNVIYQAIAVLYNKQADSVATIWNISDNVWQPHLVKKNIIQHSIYGVDIESGAVDIARLRFWLALVVDEIEPLPLPNLDYKIMQGNSLLESFEGIDLSQISDASAYEEEFLSDQIDMFSGEANKSVSISLNFEDIKTLMDEYFNANDPDTKKVIHKKIDDQVLNHIRFTLLQHKQSIVTKKIPLERKLKLDEASASTLQQKEKIRTASKQAKELSKINGELQLFHEKEIKLSQLSNSNERPFFLWHLFFKEVFDEGGFDIVIGNPPYVKEYENKDAFNGLRNLECYQGKMDIWYLFGDLGLQILKPNSFLCYIATNNWVTNSGASNFRNIVVKNSQIINITDFGAYMIFENASIQTMIMLLKNTKTTDNYNFDYRKLEGDKLVLQDVLNLLEGVETEKSFILSPFVTKIGLIDKTLTFNTNENSGLLNKIKLKQNFFLREKSDKTLGLKSEIANGIHHHHDIVNKARKELLNNMFDVNTGIFVLSTEEVGKLMLTEKEMELIKPQFSSKQVLRYYTKPNNEDWVIYTRSEINKPDDLTKKASIDNYPRIKEHLDKFSSVITSDFAPYGLHRAREQYFFDGEKIAVLRKCSKEPLFSYSDFECYLPAAFYIIKSDRINLKYLTGLLNSKLITFWLKKKGKMQGNNYQLDKEPLIEIPIYMPSVKESDEIVELFNEIISLKEQGKDSSEQENKIDQLVFKLYDISPVEQKVIFGT